MTKAPKPERAQANVLACLDRRDLAAFRRLRDMYNLENDGAVIEWLLRYEAVTQVSHVKSR